jgi:hypothetical protein
VLPAVPAVATRVGTCATHLSQSLGPSTMGADGRDGAGLAGGGGGRRSAGVEQGNVVPPASRASYEQLFMRLRPRAGRTPSPHCRCGRYVANKHHTVYEVFNYQHPPSRTAAPWRGQGRTCDSPRSRSRRPPSRLRRPRRSGRGGRLRLAFSRLVVVS